MAKVKPANKAPKVKIDGVENRVATPGYKGKITTTGTSEGIRLDKSLFKQHPEFKQKADVVANVIGPGTLLISLTMNTPEAESESDPVVSAFLSFLEKEMLGTPKTISRVSEDRIARAKALTANMTVTDDELE